MTTHTVCVGFKCKHCDKILPLESSRPGNKEKFWWSTAQNWTDALKGHISKAHLTLAQGLDMKNDWNLHYGKGAPTLKERIQKEEKKTVVKKSFPCDVCEKVFEQIGSLKIHTRVHEPKEYSCGKCGKVCSKKANLKSHMNSHEPEKLYPCDECGKVFIRKGNLKVHMVYHSEHRPFPCQCCSKSFKNSRDLKFHTRIHTGERPYSCNRCDKTFVQAVQMQNHMKKKTPCTPNSPQQLSSIV